MSDISNIIFELERRVILFKPNTSMPDGSQLGFDDNPNNILLETDDAGQLLIINCPVGSRYQQSTGVQWYKKELPNTWELFGAGEAPIDFDSLLVSMIRTNKDANDIFTTISFLDLFSVIRRTSILSGGVPPFYDIRTETDFDASGLTSISVKVFDLFYDIDGSFVSEVMRNIF